MKCLSCGKEEFDECTINVEGKIYGLVTKTKNNREKATLMNIRNISTIWLKMK